MNRLVSSFPAIPSLACAGLLLLPHAADAYVGPGAGLSLVGALWALVVAIAAAVAFIVAWPIRRMRRRKREEKEAAELEREGAAPEAVDADKSRSRAAPAPEATEPRRP